MNEELTLLPCPACGGRAWAHYEPTTIRMYCPCCDILGPKKNTIEEARAAWNTLPRTLEWTDEPPKVPGWYWYRNSNNDIVKIMHITSRPFGIDAGTQLYAGPIPEPREPK